MGQHSVTTMIEKLYLLEGDGFDPHYNLAVEEALLDLTENACILYLWQNQNTVVIGQNQNAWRECRTALLEEEGGRLARRLSGGGAVFHDVGNLNFTLLMPSEDYDLDRQFAVIEGACRILGIPTERSGRNDVLAMGRKFSGNAFYRGKHASYHHGTLLVDVDMEKLGRYLSPSKAKLEAKGVSSVRSRVVNLKELCPNLTTEGLKAAMVQAFSEVYALPVETLSAAELDAEKVEALRLRNASWEWNYGRKLPFSVTVEGRFDWGGVEVGLDVESGIIRAAKVYTDAMDETLPERLERAMVGRKLAKEELRDLPEDVQELLCDIM